MSNHICLQGSLKNLTETGISGILVSACIYFQTILKISLVMTEKLPVNEHLDSYNQRIYLFLNRSR